MKDWLTGVCAPFNISDATEKRYERFLNEEVHMSEPTHGSSRSGFGSQLVILRTPSDGFSADVLRTYLAAGSADLKEADAVLDLRLLGHRFGLPTTCYITGR